MLGDYRAAAADWRSVSELSSNESDRRQFDLSRLAALARAGDRQTAIDEAAAWERSKALSPGDAYNLACVYSLAGDAARAIEMLQRAKAGGFFKDPGMVAHLQTDPDLAPLRLGDDYAEFMGKLNEEERTTDDTENTEGKREERRR
jgi:hypothetical protein